MRLCTPLFQCACAYIPNREETIPLWYTYLPFDLLVYFTGLSCEAVGQGYVSYGLGANISLSLCLSERPGVWKLCTLTLKATAGSKFRGASSRYSALTTRSPGTVTRYTIYSGYAHAYVHLFHAMRRYRVEESISFPEPMCLLVSAKTRCLGADQKTRGLWEHDCRRISLQCTWFQIIREDQVVPKTYLHGLWAISTWLEIAISRSQSWGLLSN